MVWENKTALAHLEIESQEGLEDNRKGSKLGTGKIVSIMKQ